MSPELLAIRRENARLLAEEVSAETGIPAADILGRSHERQVVAARHRLWRMLRDTGLSYPALAEVLGVHHTTLICAMSVAKTKAPPRARVRVAS